MRDRPSARLLRVGTLELDISRASAGLRVEAGTRVRARVRLSAHGKLRLARPSPRRRTRRELAPTPNAADNPERFKPSADAIERVERASRGETDTRVA